MTSRATIAEFAEPDIGVVVPYAGEQRRLRELVATRATFTPEDYSAIRQALGGGKRGRARARELAPLVCPVCSCRLTLYERAGRSPYFAPTQSDATHGAACERAEQVEPVAHIEQAIVAPTVPPSANVPLHYVIDAQAMYETAAAARTLAEDGTHASESIHYLADARELLVRALNRAVPNASHVTYRGQSFAITSAAELASRHDGQLVAVYGRLSEAEWNEASGRLILRATPRSVQVWATAAVPRTLLGAKPDQPINAPSFPKPLPFLAFGNLRKLAAVSGIPVIRNEYLVLLQPLTTTASVSPAEPAEVTAALTQELDELLAALP